MTLKTINGSSIDIDPSKITKYYPVKGGVEVEFKGWSVLVGYTLDEFVSLVTKESLPS